MFFSISLTNVLVMLMYMIPGFILCKVKKASPEHLSTLSAILIYFLSPCMIITAFIDMDYSRDGLINMALFFCVSLILQVAFVSILYFTLRRKYNISRYRMLTIGAVLGNVGFFGMPLLKALFPDNPEVACYSSIYVVSMNILVFTIGVYCLTLKKEYMTIKAAIVNPSTFAFIIAVGIYLTGISKHLPTQLLTSVQLLGRMTTPVCMFILGIRLATMPAARLFLTPFVYLICAFKQLVFPLFCFTAVFFLPLPATFKASILILASAPCASIILNLAEIHHSEEELSANCLLLSTLSCLITIPILSLLL